MERAARPSLNLPVWMHMHVHQPVRKGEPSLAIITVLQMYIASTHGFTSISVLLLLVSFQVPGTVALLISSSLILIVILVARVDLVLSALLMPAGQKIRPFNFQLSM